MRKIITILNIHTAIILCLALCCSYVSLKYGLIIYIDFIILGLVIVFPLTLTIKEAFKRREKAIKSLSTLKGCLTSLFYSFENKQLPDEKKRELERFLFAFSDHLQLFLSTNAKHATIPVPSCEPIVHFIRTNNETIKKEYAQKILFYLQKITEEVTFLVATKTHRTPRMIHGIILFAIYAFVIFYPASLLNKIGESAPLWYVFVMTAFKAMILISLYNAQDLIEDPFAQKSPDAIQLHQFSFTGWAEQPVLLEQPKLKEKQKAAAADLVEEDEPAE